jgi:hypothetical protein
MVRPISYKQMPEAGHLETLGHYFQVQKKDNGFYKLTRHTRRNAPNIWLAFSKLLRFDFLSFQKKNDFFPFKMEFSWLALYLKLCLKNWIRAKTSFSKTYSLVKWSYEQIKTGTSWWMIEDPPNFHKSFKNHFKTVNVFQSGIRS